MVARIAAVLALVVGVIGSAAGQAPPPSVGSIQATPGTPEEGSPVSFSATVENPSGRILTYAWDFGDGSAGRVGSTPSTGYAFENDGTYTVRLQVHDDEGRVAEGSVRVSVRNAAPEIFALDAPAQSAREEPVTIEGLARDPGEGDVLTYHWRFGDGSVQSGVDLRQVTHRFSEPGLHTVELQVEDEEGASATRTVLVPVERTFEFQLSGQVNGVAAGGFDGRPRFMAIPHESITYAGIGAGNCQISMSMQSSDGDVFELGLTAPRTIEPGVYPAGSGAGQFVVIPYPACDRPGVRCPFRPPYPTGTVELTLAAPNRIEGRLDVSFDLGNGSLTMAGPFTAVGMSVGAVSTQEGGCLSSGRLAVESVTPTVDEVNVDFEFAAVEVELTEEYDPASVNHATFRLEYRLPDDPAGRERYAQVDGVLERTAGRSFRFVPLEPLLDGVIYQATVVGGARGIRGTAGGRLRDDFSWRFATLVNLDPAPESDPVPGVVRRVPETPIRLAAMGPAVGIGGGMSPGQPVSPSAFPQVPPPVGITTAVFQVSRDAPLVPDKTTLTRVYVNWQANPAVHPTSQVTTFPAQVSIEVNGAAVGAYPAQSVTVTRPDQFTAQDSAQARNSINFFGWKPQGINGSSTVVATVDPSNQTGPRPRRFQGAPQQLAHHSASHRLSVEYSFVQFGPWRDRIPVPHRALGDAVLRDGMDFTLQNFPVADVSLVPRPPIVVQEPFRIARASAQGHRMYASLTSPLVTQHTYVARQAYLQLIRTKTVYPDVFVIVLPEHRGTEWGDTVTLAPSSAWTYERWPFAMFAVFLMDVGATDELTKLTGAVAHETGHVFGLEHRSTCAPQAVQSCLNLGKAGSDPVEGFRLARNGTTGWNKSKTEGNAQAPQTQAVLSLMYNDAIGSEGVFIQNDQYATLMSHSLFAGARAPVRSDPEPGILACWPAASGNVWASRQALLGGWRERTPESGGAVTTFARLTSTDVNWFPRNTVNGRCEPAISQPQPAAWLLVSGTLEEGGDLLVMDPVEVVDREPSWEADPGEYELLLLDSSGTTIHSARFGVFNPRSSYFWDEEGSHVQRDASPEEGGWFDVMVPRLPDVAAVEVRRGGEVLIHVSRSENAPTVRLPDPVLDADGESIGVSWSGEDADGDSVGYRLSYSADGESEWIPLTVGWTIEMDARLDRSDLPEGPRPTLKVTVTDGFREGEATVGLGFPVR